MWNAFWALNKTVYRTCGNAGLPYNMHPVKEIWCCRKYVNYVTLVINSVTVNPYVCANFDVNKTV